MKDFQEKCIYYKNAQTLKISSLQSQHVQGAAKITPTF